LRRHRRGRCGPVVVKPVRQWDEFSGRIAATDAVEVRPRVSGYIDRIAFKKAPRSRPATYCL